MLYLIADMWSRVKVALKRQREKVRVLNSKLCEKALILVEDLGYLNKHQKLSIKYLTVFLRYIGKRSLIGFIVILSKPRSRYYMKVKKIKILALKERYSNNIFFIFSTSLGLLIDIQCILFNHGGEPLFSIG